MPKKANGGQSDWEYIRAAQVERRECQLAHNVAWSIGIHLDDVRSVVGISMVAWEIAPGGDQVQLCRYATSWPNAQVQTFPACLFNAAVQLTRLVEDARRDEALVSTKRT